MAEKQQHDLPPRPKRRINTILALVLLALVLLGVYFGPIGRAWRQAADMQQLESAGLTITGYDRSHGPLEELLLEFLPSEGVWEPQYARASREISGAALEIMGTYSNWHELELRLGDEGGAELRSLVTRSVDLSSLKLKGGFSNDALPMLSKHHDLTTLAVESPNCDSALVPVIVSATSVRELVLVMDLSDDAIDELFSLPQLESLTITSADAMTSAPFVRNKSTSIKSLSVYLTHFDDVGFRAVLNWPQLEKLNVWGAAITDSALLDTAPAQPRLKSLVLTNTSVTSEVLSELSRFQQLEALYLAGTQINDDQLEQLNSLPRLKVLFLPSDVTDAGVAKLNLPNLKNLYLCGPGITSAALQNLQTQFPEIIQVMLPDCDIPNEERKALDKKYDYEIYLDFDFPKVQ